MAPRPPAATSPAAALARVRARIERGWPAGLTVLTGGDLYHLDAAAREILRALVPEAAAEFGLTVFGEQKVDLPTVIAAARSVGMFSPRRVVLVKEVGALDGEPQVLLDYAGAPPPGSHLIVRAPALDRRRKLHQALERGGTTLVFDLVEAPQAVVGEIRDMARGKGLELDTGAAELLAEVAGGDFYRVDSELEKLAAWLGPGAKRVGSGEVLEVVAGSGLLTGWEAAMAVLERDPETALGATRRLVASGEPPLRLVGGLAFLARGMLAAKLWLDRGGDAAQAIQLGRAWRYREPFLRGLARYTAGEILGFPRLLLEADRTLKSRAVDPAAVLESLVTRMIGTARAPSAERR